MAKVLTCPACGAPLSLDDDDDGVVECFYCKRHVVVASGSLTQAPARKVVASPGAPPPPPPPWQSNASAGTSTPAKGGAPVSAFLISAVLGIAITGGSYYFYRQSQQATPAREQPKLEESLAKLDLMSTQEQATALFGSPPSGIQGQLTIDSTKGPVNRVVLNWMDQDKRYISRIQVNLRQGAKDKDEVLKKLAGFVPNRVRPGPQARVSQGDAVLDVTDNGFIVWHWSSNHPQNGDLAHCLPRLNALLSLARAAALDGRAPTPEEIALANGAKLDQAGDLDTSVPVEQAVDYFQKKHPAARCRMQAGLLCMVDVDDQLVDSVHYTWPNGLSARVRQAKLELVPEKATDKALRAVAGCLEPVLGKGEEKVVDYVRGTRSWEWKLDKAGDQVLLAGRNLVVSSAESKALDQPAAWHEKLGKMLSALAACRL